MAVVNGSRPHRVNMDGKSCTELGTSAVALAPGQLVNMVDGKFVVSDGTKPYNFIVQCADNVGGSILDAIEAGESVTGDRFEAGRQYAALVVASSVCKAQETLFKMNASGQLVVATAPEDVVVAVAAEDYTVPATPAASHVKIRVV